jgi:hypothetical protein
LVASFAGSNPATLTRFSNELYYGAHLHVITLSGSRDFSLIGSHAAMNAHLACWQAIGGTAPLPPAIQQPAALPPPAQQPVRLPAPANAV